MAEDLPAYPIRPLEEAVGRGTIYVVLGWLLMVALAVTLILGFRGIVGPGLFTDETAFAIGGLTLVVLSVTVLVLTFSLSGTIRHIRRELADLDQLRENIQTSYARLRDSAETLGGEVASLRVAIVNYRKSLAAQTRRP